MRRHVLPSDVLFFKAAVIKCANAHPKKKPNKFEIVPCKIILTDVCYVIRNLLFLKEFAINYCSFLFTSQLTYYYHLLQVSHFEYGYGIQNISVAFVTFLFFRLPLFKLFFFLTTFFNFVFVINISVFITLPRRHPLFHRHLYLFYHRFHLLSRYLLRLLRLPHPRLLRYH